jgi:hypothetical protein
VNRLKKIMALLLLVLWMPITSHCLLESAGLMPEIFCCENDCSPIEKDSTDECATLETAVYKTTDGDAVLVVPDFQAVLMVVLLPAETVSLPLPASGFLTVAPPPLPVTWQFLQRAALPVRPPSVPA